MKRLLLAALLLLLLPAAATAMSGELTLGKYVGADRAASEPDNWSGAKWYAEITAEESFASVPWLHPFLAVKTYIDDSDGSFFHPASVDYGIGLRVDLGDRVSLGYAHHCWHHVDRAATESDWTPHHNQASDIVFITYRWGAR